MKVKDLDPTEHLHMGNLACAGCPETLGFRHVLKALGPVEKQCSIISIGYRSRAEYFCGLV